MSNSYEIVHDYEPSDRVKFEEMRRVLAEIVGNLSPGLPLNAKARHAVKQARTILAREERK